MNKFKILNLKFKIASIIFTFIILYFTQSTASAHKVSIYAYAEDGRIFAEGYFVDGSRAKNSLIEVFDARSGKKLLEVKTDKKGKAAFNIPKITPLKLVITASMGHKNDYTVSEDEIRQASGELMSDTIEQKPEKTVQEETDRKQEIAEEAEISSKEVEKIVERVVEKKLQPIKNILIQIEESSSKPRISEILGGIGYILGLMGIIMYFKSRKK
jgi:nickel transport protein